MYKIAICDDSKIELKDIKSSVKNICDKANPSTEIYTYQSGRELLKALLNNPNYIDILLLDIDMPDINGLDVAQALRSANSQVVLIFITSHDQYVFESFEYSPFRYVRKNKINYELQAALNAALQLLESYKSQMISVKTNSETMLIKQSDIVYIETSGHYLSLILKSSEIVKTRMTIKAMETKLNSINFIKIHSGCLVNIKYINKFSNFDITLDNGIHLSVSRSKLKSVKELLIKYWRSRI